ncbi:MAG: EAL domain-containing protein [Nocardioidaceae bacterium]
MNSGVMESRLRAAVRAGGLDLHYQPVVDLSNGATTGVEALARWTDDELGVVPPDVFIPLAETSDLIVELGRWVLGHACRQAVAWSADGGAPLMMSVNVSPVQLREPSFVDDVHRALEESGLAPERLVLEVTETAIVTDVPDAAATLHKVRDLGVQFALDDFGTGHSSLTLLRNLPLQSVKIDRSLINKVATGAQDAVLVQLVVDAAHTLGLRVCAEGVEEVDQAQQLVSLGCDSGQGWLFGRPVPATPATRPSTDEGRTWLGLTGTPPVALSGSEDLVVVTDRHRSITYVSASSRRILGRMPSEVVGRPLADLLGVGHDEGPVTLQVPHRDGGMRWLRGVVQPLYDGTGDVREILSVLTDVTSTVLGDQALADSEELFRSAFSGAPIGIALSDFDGRLVRVNPALALLLGRTAGDLLKMSVADITHPDDLSDDAANLAEVRTGAVRQHRVAKRYLHADGHAIPVEVYAASVHTAAGEPYCVVAHVLPAGTPLSS